MSEEQVERTTWVDGDVRIDPPPVARALEALGVIASGAVMAREGATNPLQRPDRAAARMLGDDGLGRAFDALVASGALEQADLLATAVERSHEYYGVPAVLASGEARRWAGMVPDEAAADMLYDEAPAAFAQWQSDQSVRRAELRSRVKP